MTGVRGWWPARYPSSLRELVREGCVVLWRGRVERSDGTRYRTRRHWLGYLGHVISRWLRAPVVCKIGRHRVGPESDCGIAVGDASGRMDVLCLDCRRNLRVPVDDALAIRGAGWVLDERRRVRREQADG